MKVRFTADYDHRWPSRAITAFRAGYEGTVKREVGERAIAKRKATEVSAPAKPDSDASGDNQRPDALGGGDTRPSDAGRARGVRRKPGRNGNGTGSALPSNQLAGDAQ